MIKNITYTLSIFFFLSLFSCTSEEENTTDTKTEVSSNENEEHDTIEDQNDSEDTITQIADVYEDEDQKESIEKIEKEYGKQWDFCTCVVKNDSVNKAIEGDVSDADLDFLLERLDYLEVKCKGMLILPNATPDERDEHQKKVNNCLKANK